MAKKGKVKNKNKTILIAAQDNGIRVNSLVGSVFANGPGDWGSIPGRVIPKTFLKNGTWYLFA